MYACAYISTCYTCFASTAMIFDDRWGKDGEEQIEHGTEKLRWRERRKDCARMVLGTRVCMHVLAQARDCTCMQTHDSVMLSIHCTTGLALACTHAYLCRGQRRDGCC